MLLNDQHVFPLERVRSTWRGYFINAKGEFFSNRQGSLRRLAGSSTPSGRYYTLAGQTEREDRVTKLALAHKDWAKEVTPPSAKVAALTASSPKGRSHAASLAQGIAARGVVLAVEEDGKLLFGSKPVIHTSEASWKDEATRVAMLNPGKRVVALKVVGAVVAGGIRWE